MPGLLRTTPICFALLCLGGCPASDEGDATDDPPASQTFGSTGEPGSGGEPQAGSSTSGGADESSESSGGLASADPLEGFWDAFRADDYTRIPTVIADLHEARSADPSDADLQFIYGHANLWKLAELARDPDALAEQPALAAEAIAGLREAIVLRPDDARIPCWVGLLELQAGRLFADDELIAAGRVNVQSTVDRFPEFGHFCKILADWDAPRDSEEFAAAVEAGWASIDVCLDDPIDREDPDVEPFLDQATDEGPRRVCWNIPTAPHNEEGYWLVIGDLFTKAGDAELARTMYRNAMYRPSFETWGYRADLEARLSSVDERVAAFGDGDASNEPDLGLPEAACVMCHAN